MEAFSVDRGLVAKVLKVKVAGKVGGVFLVGGELCGEHFSSGSGLFDGIDVGAVSCHNAEFSCATVPQVLN